MNSISQTRAGKPIIIEGLRFLSHTDLARFSEKDMRFVTSADVTEMSVPPVVVENDEAISLREGLRGSVIENDLQSLFQLHGVDMLTGSCSGLPT
ncbi:hypothetical protein [Brucella tritici]|uniref:Uncharacterized protein n=1 Tax=Brucella tritici TaxID=94626 RepID=A0A6L3YF95_9HYPH|nr:hypothetical protein [Brucella tritici]KAB2681134.1 hypothetical protein F9L08_19725 [Brucella tritici]